MRMPLLRSLFGETQDEVNQSDIVMLLTPHIVRTHELTVEDLSSIFIGTQQNVGLGGPPPLIAPQPIEPLPSVGATGNPAAGATGAAGGDTRTPSNPAPGVPPTNPPLPPGTSAVPTLTPPGPPPPASAPGSLPRGATGGLTPPTGTPATGVNPTTGNPSVGGNPSTGVSPAPGVNPDTAPQPARDLGAAPTPRPRHPPGTRPAQVIITPPGTEVRVAGGTYTVPLSINNASRVSLVTLTVTFNPAALRVRTVQDGTFMRQGAVTATFTPRIDNATGRVDIAIARSSDPAGASGSGLLAVLLVDAVGPGNSLIQVSGIASTPEGAPVNLQFSPVTVTVR